MNEVGKELQDHWDSHFRDKGDIEYSFEYKRLGPRDRRVVESLSSFGVEDRNCLDVGFGTGRWLQYMKQNGASYLGGLDISAEAVNKASGFCDKVELADLESDPFPFESDFFDVVVSFEVLEHLRDPSLYLNEISRVLRKDGVCLLSFPNLTSFSSRLRMLLGRKAVSFGDKTHLRHYVHGEVEALLNSHGFVVEFLPTGFTLNPFNLKSRFRFPSLQFVRSLEDGIVLKMHHA